MWTATASIAATDPSQACWRLFEDVAGWTNWNAGIALHGPFAAGSTLDMRPDAGVVDEPLLGGTCFRVSHELQPLPAGGTRVTYAIQVDGPDAETLGPLVTADFPEVLAALKALAERACEGAS